jgi:hypothetical protein
MIAVMRLAASIVMHVAAFAELLFDLRTPALSEKVGRLQTDGVPQAGAFSYTPQFERQRLVEDSGMSGNSWSRGD